MGWPTRRQMQRQIKKEKGPILWNELIKAIRSDIKEYLSVFQHNGVSISTDPKSEDLDRQDLNIFVADSSVAPSPPKTTNILFTFDPKGASIAATVSTKPNDQGKQYFWKVVSDQEGDDACLIELVDGRVARSGFQRHSSPRNCSNQNGLRRTYWPRGCRKSVEEFIVETNNYPLGEGMARWICVNRTPRRCRSHASLSFGRRKPATDTARRQLHLPDLRDTLP